MSANHPEATGRRELRDPGTPLGRPAGGCVLRLTGFQRTVTDLNRAIDFYCGALGFSHDRTEPCVDEEAREIAIEAPSRCARLVLGDESIELVTRVRSGSCTGGRMVEAAVSSLGFQHVAIVTRDMRAALLRLQRFAPRSISSDGAVRLPANTGGVTAYKFRDLDGQPLELISFPEGAGDPRWRRASLRELTVGIDHSAIGVGDIERSLAFYVKGLGFRLSSRQVNRGPEQARLDGTSESVVDVVGLTPFLDPVPHLELLGYRTPAPRPRAGSVPIVEDRSDRLVITVDDFSAVVSRLDDLLHSAPDGPEERMSTGSGSLLVRDPDGHLLLLRQESWQRRSREM